MAVWHWTEMDDDLVDAGPSSPSSQVSPWSRQEPVSSQRRGLTIQGTQGSLEPHRIRCQSLAFVVQQWHLVAMMVPLGSSKLALTVSTVNQQKSTQPWKKLEGVM
jgi:hypothetical protein